MDKIRKFFRLIAGFAQTAKLYLFFITVVMAVIFFLIALVCGKLTFFADSYTMFRRAELENDVYFAIPVARTKIPAMRASLLETEGVTGLVEGPVPDRVELEGGTKDEPLSASFLRYEEPLYDKFTPRLISGGGFDYSSDEPECIITDRSGRFGSVHVGEKLSFTLAGTEKTLVLTVAGIAAENSVYPLMMGGGTGTTAAMIAGMTDQIIVKDSPLVSGALDDVMGGRYASQRLGIFSVFVETDDALTDEERAAVLEKCVAVGGERYALYGGDIIENSRKELAYSIKTYAPLFLFMLIFFITTVVCTVTLSVYRYAGSYAVYRMLGGSERVVVMTICSAFFACIIAAALITAAAFIYIMNSSLAANELFSDTILSPGALLPVLIAALLTCTATAIIVRKASVGQELRAISARYSE